MIYHSALNSFSMEDLRFCRADQMQYFLEVYIIKGELQYFLEVYIIKGGMQYFLEVYIIKGGLCLPVRRALCWTLPPTRGSVCHKTLPPFLQ